MSTVGDPLEHALDSADTRLEDALDLVDEAVERAAAEADGAALQRLAQRLDEVASERGGEWRALAVAAARARALAAHAGAPPAVVEAAPPPAVAAEPQLVYAGVWRRSVAFGLDWIVIALALGFVDSALGESTWVALALVVAYFSALPALADGVTPGKVALGIAIRDDDGMPIYFERALGRTLATLGLWVTVVGAVVDVILAATDSRHQSAHDKIAGTIVVRTRT